MSKRRRKTRRRVPRNPGERPLRPRGGWVAPLQGSQFAGLTAAVGDQANGSTEGYGFGEGAGDAGGDGGGAP